MILVDTSVLIDYFKGKDNREIRALDQILLDGIPYGINDFIYQELLQGSRTIEEFKTQKKYLETIPFYYLKNGRESYEKAAYLNFKCRRSGITVNSTVDLLIAETAIENNLYLLHNDKDFLNMSKIVPELKIYEVNE
ncbi:MAG TPA: PIN domain nuclease [Desulfobacteraceae bacterium]|nr:PIN domain nuclease [Desulfobacteraceae bacterium]HPJ68305.1 PIN domain nuclease [Desulfobacteraceae bacterium]HPQ29662.1 PIN domain nuclease [Desulfobacteraceae bacterium]